MGNYICHHGIKGQKWGDKNGPPYPLDKSVSTKIKKRAEENKDTDKPKKGIRVKIDLDPDGKEHKWLRNRYYPGYDPIMHPDELEERKIIGSHSINNDASKVNEWHIEHPIGGGTYNCSNCATAYELRRRGYDVVSRSEIDGTKMKDITKFFSGARAINVGEDNKNNPLFNDSRIKSIYEKYDKLIKDAKKQGKNSDVWMLKYDREDEVWADEFNNDVGDMLSKLHKMQEDTADKLCDALIKMPNGSRGAITIGWAPEEGFEGSMFAGRQATSFHAINYEKQKGIVYIVDSQSGDVTYFKTLKDANGGYPVIKPDYIDPRSLSYIPLDSLEINKDAVVDAVISSFYKRA